MAKKASAPKPPVRLQRPKAKKAAPRKHTKSATQPSRAAPAASAATRAPEEWQDGRIVPASPPAKPLQGRNSQRIPVDTIRDADDRPIPRTVSEWFVRKLDASHKVSARTGDYATQDYSKKPHVSPEAASLLREKAAAWAHLIGQERDAVREREQARLESLATITAPDEFRDGKVVLPKPNQPVAIAHCWKADFEGELYQAVLHFYEYLPAEHMSTITAPNGFPAKVMSPEAAQLYREHRGFWEAIHAESKTESAARRKSAEAGVKRAAASAGLSRVELESKLDRLAMLVEEDNLLLAAEMIAAFGDAWLYEALLAGASVDPDGDIKPGRILKRFGRRAAFVVVSALAAMPDGVALDRSLHRDAFMTIAVAPDTLDLLADIAPRLPNLKPRVARGGLPELEALRGAAAEFLARHGSPLRLEIRSLELAEAESLTKHDGHLHLAELESIDPDVAAALAAHRGDLSLGLTELSAAVATSLAGHRGELAFPRVSTISPDAAAAFERHAGTLTLGDAHSSFTLSALAAGHLGRHGGPLNLPGVRRLGREAVEAIASQAHGVRLGIKSLPAGSLAVALCRRMAASPGDCLQLSLTTLNEECAAALASFTGNQLSLPALMSLSAECATALSAFPGKLSLGLKTWTDQALLALARQPRELEINPPEITSEVAAALAGRGPDTTLTFFGHESLSLSDAAADSLRAYGGKLAFLRFLSISAAAARRLAKRDVLVLNRSHLPVAHRKHFDSAGTWKHGMWFRHDRSARTDPENDARE